MSTARVADAAAELTALAAGLCHSTGLTLTVGDRWAFATSTGTLIVSEADLEAHGARACAGLVAHEVGHALISRYNDLREVAPLPISQAYWRAILNSIEDGRVEQWMRRRFPGAHLWLDELLDRQAKPAELPPVVELLFALADEGERDFASVDTQFKTVRYVLERTRPPRALYTRVLVPPPDDARLEALAADPRWLSVFETHVTPRLIEPMALPVPDELVTTVIAWQGLTVLERDVLPVVARFYEEERARLARLFHRRTELQTRAKEAIARRDLLELARIARMAGVTSVDEANVGRSPHHLGELAAELLDLLISPRAASSRPSGLGMVRVAHGTPPRGAHGHIESIDLSSLAAPPVDVGALTEVLVDRLERILLPRRRLGFRPAGVTGARPNIRRAMQFEADRRRYDLWERPLLPDRRDAVFSLLVDLSGSMRGGKIQHALGAVRLLVDVLDRLAVPARVDGFQDALIPFLDFHTPRDEKAREMLAEMPLEVQGRRPGGHNAQSFNDDGPCLDEAARLLLDRPEPDRVLIVLSDGRPEGRRSDESDLRRTIRKLAGEPVHLIGVGVGKGTGHVREFYPESVADVAPEKLAECLGGLIERCLVLGVTGHAAAMPDAAANDRERRGERLEPW